MISSTQVIYPGHPLVIAYLIVGRYASLRKALRGSASGYPSALTSARIPGAGGNVHAALDFLERVIDNRLPFEDAVKHANAWWACCDNQATSGTLSGRWRSGQKQADQILDLLRQRLALWPRGEE